MDETDEECDEMPSTFRIIIVILLALIALCVGMTITLMQAHAHDWYDPVCCSGKDCKPVRSIVFRDDGSMIMTTEDGISVLVPAALTRRPSLDSRWHVCPYPTYGSDVEGVVPMARCVYEPPNT